MTNNEREASHYLIRDTRTGRTMSSHATRKSASRKADRLDREYGAVRYVVEPQWRDVGR